MRKLSQGVFEISRPHIQEVFEQETKTDILIAVKVKAAQSCPTLCDPMDYLIHGIPQARILEWVAFPFSKVSSQPRDRTQVSWIAGRFFTSWATREIQEYWSRYPIPSNIIWLQSLHFYHQNTVTLKKLAVMAAAPPPPSNKNFDDSLMATKHPRPLQKILHPWHWVILPSLKTSSNCFLSIVASERLPDTPENQLENHPEAATLIKHLSIRDYLCISSFYPMKLTPLWNLELLLKWKWQQMVFLY